jgi:hypothetical protein
LRNTILILYYLKFKNLLFKYLKHFWLSFVFKNFVIIVLDIVAAVVAVVVAADELDESNLPPDFGPAAAACSRSREETSDGSLQRLRLRARQACSLCPSVSKNKLVLTFKSVL